MPRRTFFVSLPGLLRRLRTPLTSATPARASGSFSRRCVRAGFGVLAAVLCCIVAEAPAHGAGSPSVVLVQTEGGRAWQAAERRLLAELRTLDIRVVLLPGRRTQDRAMPSHAQTYQAVVVLQALREDHFGVVRLWVAPGAAPGGYSHMRVDMRGAGVLERAVTPVFAATFARVAEAEGRVQVKRGRDAATALDGRAEGRTRAKREDRGAPRSTPKTAPERVQPFVSVGAAGGPWLWTGAVESVLVVALTGRLNLSRYGALELSGLTPLALPPSPTPAPRVGTRVLALANPWPRGRVEASVGFGVGSVATTRGLVRILGVARAGLRAPVTEQLGLALDVTNMFEIVETGHGPPPLGAGLDMLVSVQWNFGKGALLRE